MNVIGNGRPLRLLVADDEPVILSALTDLVAANPSVELVGTARNAEEAAAEAEAHRPDVALVDVRMPGGGDTATREIRARSPGTRVVAFTAYEDRATVVRMVRAGAVGYLVKGAVAEDLWAELHRALRGEAAFSGEAVGAVVQELSDHLAREELSEENRRATVHRIRAVLEQKTFTLVFQPIVELSTRAVQGFEALARFPEPDGRGPVWWFSQAREVGLLEQLETELLQAAVVQGERLPRRAYLSVNISPATVSAPRFRDLAQSLPAERLVLEVTEHAAVEDYRALKEALDDWRARGGRMAVDDAGAGFASLQHILQLGPDFIKLDAALTRGVRHDQARQALALGLISFAGRMGAAIVAEGIERQDELECLRELGVPYGQGFHLGRPGPLPS